MQIIWEPFIRINVMHSFYLSGRKTCTTFRKDGRLKAKALNYTYTFCNMTNVYIYTYACALMQHMWIANGSFFYHVLCMGCVGTVVIYYYHYARHSLWNLRHFQLHICRAQISLLIVYEGLIVFQTGHDIYD